MNKGEFIDILKQNLVGEVSNNEIENNVIYYNEYITYQYNSGKTYETIFEELGDPRLIAKTIIEAFNVSRGPINGNGYTHNSTGQNEYQKHSNFNEQNYNQASNAGEEDGKRPNFSNSKIKFAGFNSSTWYNKLISILVTILVMIIVIFLGGIAIRLFFTIGVPILVILFLYKIITKR